MTGYDAVLFDSDGVLVEPPARETQAAATRAALRAVGAERVDDRHVAAVVDGVTVDELHGIRGAYDLDPEAFWTARERHDERSQLDASGPDAGTATRTSRSSLASPRPAAS